MSDERERIREELTLVKEELRRLDEARQDLLSRKENLTRALCEVKECSTAQGTLFSPLFSPTPVTKRSSSAEKISLFASLFRGREDVFPRRFESNITGRGGYQPACKNQWKAGVCLKPKIKCAACKSRAFIPVTADLFEAHLRGHLQGERPGRDFTMGVYPLLLDETCCFLAVDFDKDSWREDALAYLDICGGRGVPAYLERSRSGNGGHVWIFFERPLSAKTARQLGASLLTETMERYPHLGFESYDRFFPNQDTLPQGGFGNLIALPLQNRPRINGNSLFLDPAAFEPWEDQWVALSSFRRMPVREAEALVAEAERIGGVLGVRIVEAEDELEQKRPWAMSPSRNHLRQPIQGALPPKMTLILSDGVYIEKSELTPALRNRLIRISAFQNPEFYKNQAMRLSTWDKPRIISCCRDSTNHLNLPRGCLDDVRQLLDAHNIETTIVDNRVTGKPLSAKDFKFTGKLRPQQKKAAEELLRFETGVLCASTAFGKTVVAVYIIAKRKVNTLVLVHRTQLMEQWVARLSAFLGSEAIGRVGAGKRQVTGNIDVAMIQSLYTKGEVGDIVADYGQVIVDECHHLAASSFEAVISRSKARYVLGLSATITRQNGHHPIVFMQCGPVRYKVDDRQQARERPFSHHVLIRRTDFTLPEELAADGNLKIYDLYRALAEDETRNALIAADVLNALVQGKSPVVITERTDHLERLAELLRRHTPHVIVLRGGMSARQRREAETLLGQIPEPRILAATGKYLGEGYDDARLDALFLCLPISWKGTVAQYAGRLHRLNDRKKEVVIYDYLDDKVPMLLKMFAKRQRGYRAIGYDMKETDMKKTDMKETDMKETDMWETDIREAGGSEAGNAAGEETSPDVR
ncbi:MAG: DEAD/DEAH box helicase [Synergistaceae bacterium]|jgi:superfamily II DNA or RNA helicase|nr:DEAD/DEAH box helicase [Synergistaceae bacterium]